MSLIVTSSVTQVLGSKKIAKTERSRFNVFFKNFTMFRRTLDAEKLYLSLLLHHFQHITIIRTTPFDARQDPFYCTISMYYTGQQQADRGKVLG